MGYFIALDAGGTKTETLLLDESGRILLREISLGCNAMDMGLEERCAALSPPCAGWRSTFPAASRTMPFAASHP